MAKLKVTCELKDYSEPSMPSIRVHNHWNDPNLITLEIEGKRYTVAGNDLKMAVDNCMNSGSVEGGIKLKDITVTRKGNVTKYEGEGFIAHLQWYEEDKVFFFGIACSSPKCWWCSAENKELAEFAAEKMIDETMQSMNKSEKRGFKQARPQQWIKKSMFIECPMCGTEFDDEIICILKGYPKHCMECGSILRSPSEGEDNDD